MARKILLCVFLFVVYIQGQKLLNERIHYSKLSQVVSSSRTPKKTSRLMTEDNCKLSEGSSGKCTLLKKCQPAIIAIRSGLYPETCGFEGKVPLVCCRTGTPQHETISQQKCREYSTFVPEFQIFAITGGIQSEPSEFPHMAALGYMNGNEVVWQCGGSLVSENYILTAGHCLNHLTFGPVSHARLGSIMLPSSGKSTPTSTPQDITIASRIPHPDYHSPSTYNDIALLRLTHPVQFTSFVKPACLYHSAVIPTNEELIASGWGLTEQGGNQSDTLQKVVLDMFSENECNETYKSMGGSRRLREGIRNREQFCAGGRNSGKDTCQGDSGGPLQIFSQAERIWNIVGVTSFGKVCGASIPGVYSRVSYYIPWLETVIWATN